MDLLRKKHRQNLFSTNYGLRCRAGVVVVQLPREDTRNSSPRKKDGVASDDENFMAAIARIRKKGLLECFRRREDDAHPVRDDPEVIP